MLPSLRRFFREEEKMASLLSVRSTDGVSKMSAFMDLDPHRSLLVEDVVEPVKYRVYPDTPYSEVADLMVRRELHAVPVVGADYEFLGVITTGDAMEELVSRNRVESIGGNSSVARTELTAREIMTRTVMCISEEQSLIEAASIMVNRGVEQLPVIREGEMIGLLTRREVLRWLFPDTWSKDD
jgi:CBS domain-containing protein